MKGRIPRRQIIITILNLPKEALKEFVQPSKYDFVREDLAVGYPADQLRQHHRHDGRSQAKHKLAIIAKVL